MDDKQRNMLSLIISLACMSIIILIPVFVSKAIDYKDNYNVDYYRINLDWNGELKNGFTRIDKELFDIKLKQGKEYGGNYYYTESISKEEFINFSEEEYMNLILNIKELINGLNYNSFKIVFEDGTLISYPEHLDMNNGIYEAENKPDHYTSIGKITSEINDNHTIYNVKYVEMR